MKNYIRFFASLGLGFILTTNEVSAATATWNGASGTDTNWSDGANWSGGTGTAGVPGSTDDVVFGNTGNATTITAIGNVVDSAGGNFLGTVSSLAYTNSVSGSFQNTLIAPGVTLNVTNNTGPFGSALFAGTPTAAAAAASVFASIQGAGATLNVNNTNANIVVSQSGANTALATLNMTNLDNFIGNVSKIAIGDMLFGISTVAAQGSLILAKTNMITTSWVGNHSNPYATTAQPTNAIQLGVGGSATLGGINALYLGLTNGIFTDSIGVGGVKSGGSATVASLMAFAPVFTNSSPTAYFRGINGNNSRIALWGVGDTAINSGSSAQAAGKVDLSNGSVDALVDNMILARDRNGTAGTDIGIFIFSAGTVNVNTLTVGDQGSAATGQICVGTMSINGASAVLAINTALELGHTTLTGGPQVALNTSGVLNVTNGRVLANNIVVGVSSTTNIINLVNGTLIVTNTLATNAAGLFSLNLSNSTIGLTVAANGSLKGLVQTLNTVGATNFIRLDAAPVIFSSYPQQFPLIKYTAWTGSNTFGLANIPAWAPGATLVSNGPNKSLDWSLPSDPRPVITVQPTSYSGSPGDNVTANFAVTIAATSVTPLSYQWYYYTNGGSTNLLVDGNGPSGTSTISGSTTANLQMFNSTNSDSGNYFVVITNIYGSATSGPAILTISAGGAPLISPAPQNQTVIQGNNATFTTGVSASPEATIYWQTGGTNIPGANSSTLVVNNVQYPANDQQVYYIFATNSFGAVSNSATLTVIVPPTITVQPVSLVVTNTQSASFSVTVTGDVPPAAYQWNKNGNPIPGATSATLNFASVTPADISTNYSVTITNLAGVTNSVSVSLTVNSTMSAVTLSPTNGATGVCYDTPLYITFDRPPLTRNAGKIKIYNVTNSTTPVDTLDMGQNSIISQNGTGIATYPVNVQPRTIAGASYVTFPVIITSNTAAIYPHEGVMTSNQTYYVTIDSGVFTDTNGAYFLSVTATNVWQFTTKPVGPVVGTNYLVVSTDGTADFCTIQGAVDFLPNFTNTTSFNRVIYLRKGNSVEIVRIPVGKNNITLRGESRQQSLLSYPNSNLINPSSHTVMVLHVLANDIAIENMKLTNSVPQGGSQSFALMVETGAKRFICNNADVDSYQDTILVNTSDSTAYFYKSLIQGDVDFIWGGGNCFFTNCELRELRTGGIYLQPRTTAGSNGMSFVRCSLTRFNGTNASGSNFTNCLFARALGNTNANVALIFCNIDTNAVQIGWTGSDIADPGLAERWWEFGNSNLDGTAPAIYNGIQLTSSDPRLLAAQNATIWLNGWVPQLAPNIVTQPTNVTVTAGETAVLAVSATGISDPVYQWLQNGINAPYPSANNGTLTIPNTQTGDAAAYSVIISNSAGSVTSSVVTLTVITPTPATINGVAQLSTGNFRFSIAGTQGADYRVWATTNIALTPIIGTWNLLSSGTFGVGPVMFTDSLATNFPQRFYIITTP